VALKPAPSKSSYIFVLLIAVLLLACVGVGLYGESMSYEQAKSFVDSLSDDQVDFFDEYYFHMILDKMWLGLGLLAGLAVVLLFLSKWVAVELDRLMMVYQSFISDMMQGIRDGWQDLSPWGKGILTGITLLGIGLRLLYINDGLEYDESFSYLFFASRPLYVGLSYYQLPNNHLLYTMFMHIGIQIFGTSAWAVRLPALIFGIAAIPVTYYLGRRVLNANAGLIAAMLVSTSHWMIRYSTQGRGYSLQLLFILLMALLAFYLRERNNRAAWLNMSMLAALTVHTIPTGIYPVTFLWVWMAQALKYPMGTRLRYLIGYGFQAVVVAAILYLPVFIVSGARSVIANQYVISLTGSEWKEQIPQWIAGFHDYAVGTLPVALQIVLLIAIIAGIVLHSWKRKPWPFIVPLVVVTLAMIVIQQVHPFTRVWTYVVPFLAIAAASGFVLLNERLVRSPNATNLSTVIVGVFLLGALVTSEVLHYTSTMDHRRRYEQGMITAADWLNDNLEEEDFVCWNMSFPVLGYYLDKYGEGRQVLYGKSESDSGRVFFIHDLNRDIPIELDEAELTAEDLRTMQEVFANGNMTIHLVTR
jgi:Dolichyl-phosphate-mannose-protein mannosyltransferase